jgi:excisionase family DNA binding protein
MTMTKAEVAALFQVSPRTIAHWAQKRLIPYQRTLGGHYRFNDDEVHALAATLKHPATGPPPRRTG